MALTSDTVKRDYNRAKPDRPHLPLRNVTGHVLCTFGVEACVWGLLLLTTRVAKIFAGQFSGP
jgi:hypothetical protein